MSTQPPKLHLREPHGGARCSRLVPADSLREPAEFAAMRVQAPFALCATCLASTRRAQRLARQVRS